MDKFKVIQFCILKCILRSESLTDTLKLMVLSYLFYFLMWDFDYFSICSDLENGILDNKIYYFDNIQNPPSETK